MQRELGEDINRDSSSGSVQWVCLSECENNTICINETRKRESTELVLRERGMFSINSVQARVTCRRASCEWLVCSEMLISACS